MLSETDVFSSIMMIGKRLKNVKLKRRVHTKFHTYFINVDENLNNIVLYTNFKTALGVYLFLSHAKCY